MRRTITLAATLFILGSWSGAPAQTGAGDGKPLTWPGRKEAPDTTPALAVAIARADNDCVPDQPYMDAGARRVRLPESVQRAIHAMALPEIKREVGTEKAETRLHLSQHPEDKNRYRVLPDGILPKADHYGPIFRIDAPGPTNRHRVYAFRLRTVMSFFHFVILVHDTRTDRVTAKPVEFTARWMSRRKDWHNIRPPLIHFDDLDQDGRREVVFQTSAHNGTEIDLASYHYLQVGSDLSLTEVFQRETRLFDGWARNDGRRGYINRAIEKLAPGRIRLTSLLVTHPFDTTGELAGTVILEQRKRGEPFRVVSRQVRLPRYKGLLVNVCGD